MNKILLSIIFFLVGFLVAFQVASYLLRGIPRVSILPVRTDESQELYQALRQCGADARLLVAMDGNMLDFMDGIIREYDGRFNGGKPIDANRYADLDAMYRERSPTVKRMLEVSEYRSIER